MSFLFSIFKISFLLPFLLVVSIGFAIFPTTVFAQTSNDISVGDTMNSTTPVSSFNNPSGYSIAKKHMYDSPELDIHFYCSGSSGGLLATCLLFNGNSTNSTLIGVEYIISSEQYTSLPDREKPNWSSISAEEESEARFPNLSPQQLQELFKQFEGAYVKLIITWNPNDSLPSYPPQVVIESLLGKEHGHDNEGPIS